MSNLWPSPERPFPNSPTLTLLAISAHPPQSLKLLGGASFASLLRFDNGQLFNYLVVHPSIKKPEDLNGKRLGARVKGAALWIHTVLALEKLGLDPSKDNIDILPIGDPAKV